MTDIAIYVEGGGDQRDTKNQLREAFGTFLDELREMARSKGIRWKIVACGSREQAYEDFRTAALQRPNAFNVLIVDSEEPIVDASGRISRLPWRHLEIRDRWRPPPGVWHSQCFLMVQCMEAWLIADRQNIRRYFGTRFTDGALPSNTDIEAVDKARLYASLAGATRRCKTTYHKTRHGFDLLRTSDPQAVRGAAAHCRRLFHLLAREMGEIIS